MKLKKAQHLVKGDVLELPMKKTATIVDDPHTGRLFTSFRTEYGKTRLEKNQEVMVSG